MDSRVPDRSLVTVRALEPSLTGDFLRFFDHERGPAFADNPEWASCYCQFYHTQRSIDWGARGGFASIEAYPFKSGDSEDATDHYHGPLSMFIDAGFEIIREDSTMTVVRKTLTPH